MKLNLKRMEIFTDISHKHCVVQDVREALADLIYRNCTGIKALDIAFKIFRSEEDTEYSEEECGMIMQYAEALCLPPMIDALRRVIEQTNKGGKQ